MDYKIHISGLAGGKYDYDFKVGGELFREFGNTQVSDCDVLVKVTLEKGSGWMNAVCSGNGTVTTECDRCLEEIKLPVEFSANLAIRTAKLGEETETSDEFIIVDPSEAEVDLKQFIYDSICVNMPLKRVHPEGKCNPEMVKKLQSLKAEEGKGKEDSDVYSPFSALKDLINQSKKRNK